MHKVCPIVIRGQGLERDILAFVHPKGDRQLVKGGVQPGESVQAAAARELLEESGLVGKATHVLATAAAPHSTDTWSFVLMDVSEEPKNFWSHVTQDDHGHTFHFFWQSLSQAADRGWDPPFQWAMRLIREVLGAVDFEP